MSEQAKVPSHYFSADRPMATFWPTVAALLKRPAAFFADMPSTVYYRDAIFFASLVLLLCSLLSVPFGGIEFLFLLPVTWAMMLFSLLIWAKYLHWAVRRFTDGKISTPNAFQLSSYASAPLVLAGVPLISVLAGLANLYLLWIGLVARCRISGGQAATIILVPVALLMVSLAVLMALLVRLFPQLAA